MGCMYFKFPQSLTTYHAMYLTKHHALKTYGGVEV
jgi:hypothetical protein